MKTFTVPIMIWLAGVAGDSLQPPDGGELQERPATTTARDGNKSVHKLQNLTAVAPYPGYAVLNVTASHCQSDESILLKLKSCDKEITQGKLVTCEELKNGTLMCLRLRFERTTCVTVESEGQSTGKLELPPFSMTVNITKTMTSGWSRIRNSNTSRISMSKYEGAGVYKMKLEPSKTQAACSPTEDVILHGEVKGKHVFFAADWTKLDKKCTYRTSKTFLYCSKPRSWLCGQMVRLGRYLMRKQYALKGVTSYEHCLKNVLSSPVELPHLQYVEVPDKPQKTPTADRTVLAIIGFIAFVIVMSLIYLLWTCKYKHRILAQMNEDVEKQKETLPENSKQWKVLVVYASDVAEKVADFISNLKNSINSQILDLYDHTDVEKLADGAMWLTSQFLDPCTSIIVVGSQEAKRLQAVHSSTPDACHLCALKAQEPQASKNEKRKQEAVVGDPERKASGVGRNDKEKGRNDKEEGRNDKGEGRNDKEEGRNDKEDGKGGVFHFLLINALHMVRESYVKQDYRRSYQVVFTDIPSQATLADVTPNCLYDLPGHYHYLIDALNHP